MKSGFILSLLFIFTAGIARADPQLTSWYTTFATRYARIYTTTAAMDTGSNATTWSNGSQTQSLPAYSGIQGVAYSGSWVYVYSTGLASYIMGPWYLDSAKTTIFPNWPVNQHILFRFPRSSTLGSAPTSKTLNGTGAIGLMVDGVSMFNSWDAYYWNGTEDVTSTGSGSGYWNRDAFVNEGVTFDPAYAHQQNTGVYHYHADPIGLRYLLGDHVTYNAATNTYAESTAAVTQHSPILGWVGDGYPLYGPYGYSSAMDSTSGIRRMVSGYTVRNGANGADNLTSTGRTTIPAWAQRLYNASANQSGPSVSTSYPLGRYMEDNAFLGDLVNPGTGQTWTTGSGGYDLDEFNGRYCVTPEFPNGTYAYFVAINSSGTPVFPYDIGRAYYGNPTGGAVTSATEAVTTIFNGVSGFQETAETPAVSASTGNVTITWSSVEGGTYEVQAAPDMATWATLTGSQAAATDAIETSYTDNGAASSNQKRFYEITRTALASYDPVISQGISSVSPASGTRPGDVALTITLNSSHSPAPPPDDVSPNSVTLTDGGSTITAASFSRNSSTGVVSATFDLLSGDPAGDYTVNVTFLGPAGTLSETDGFQVK
ncbi:MAG TPA: YHYH protein [Chthoniobacteraceae bacterium]|jgi:hypothetical protein|nr:YHYH protein [Chthoniobacteraceae bacterium]